MKPLWLDVGSFDPFTLGHRSIVERMTDSYNVRIGVAMNAGKSPVFTLPERLSITRKEVEVLGIDPLAVNLVQGSVARYAKRYAIDHVIRGQRNIVDEVGEEALSHFYALENPSLQIHTFPADEQFKYASSSAAKELTIVGHDVCSVVSLAVKESLESRLIRQYPIVITGSMGAGKSVYAKEITAYARANGIPISHIDFDAIAHEIYTSLTEPMYMNVRDSIRKTFDLPDSSEGWIDRKTLRTALQTDSADKNSPLDPEKLARLNELLSDAMLFRYRDKIQGIKGIILIDGATVVDNNLSYLANNHVLFVDAPEDTRIERVMARYAEKWDTVEKSFVQSLFSRQSGIQEKTAILEQNIQKERNGSMTILENDSSFRDTRKTFFRILNQIDRFGDMRATLILTFLGIQDDHDSIISDLRKLYDAPGRYYHTWEHIIACLEKLFEIATELSLSDEDMAIIGGAILFHDEIYEVTSGKYYQANEDRSAHSAYHRLKSHGVDSLKCVEISRLIRETAHGRVSLGDDMLTRIMHDIDMSILGTSAPEYRIYGHSIRNELSPLVSGSEFEKLRREKFLVPTLKEKHIFVTPYFQDTHEGQARTNLKAELNGEISFVPRDV